MAETTTTTDLDLKLISDHTDERGEPLVERLGREDMVEAIAQAIMQVDPPFTFGIYGSWGSGKTHFMKSVIGRLNHSDFHKGRSQKPITVMFEAWRHQNDEHPEIAMLTCLRNKIKEKSKGREVAIASLNTTISSLTEISVGIQPFFSVKLSPSKAREKFETWKKDEEDKHFTEIDKQVRLKENFDEAFKKAMNIMAGRPDNELTDDTSDNNNRVVFFIDDLDRCLDKTVIDMLEKIKIFLWNRHCVFVLGADHKVIEKVIAQEKKLQDDKKYLEKIVNFPFYLPPLSETTNMKFFLDKIAEKNQDKAGDTNSESEEPKEDSIKGMFAKASITANANPRKMILLANTHKLNTYLTSKTIDKENEKKNENQQHHEQITAIFTALQVLHSDAFDGICENRSGNNRQDNLNAFFLENSSESPDAIDRLLERKNAELKNSESKESIDLEAVKEIREWAWKFRSEYEVIHGAASFEKIGLLPYVDFLAAQSAAQKDKEPNSKPGIWYEDGPWVWYWKRPSASVSHTIEQSGASEEAIKEQIAAIVRNNSSSNSRPITLDGYLWRVVKLSDNSQEALLLSEDIIGRGPMDDRPDDWENYKYSWAGSALNKKLNSDAWLSKHLPTLYKNGIIQNNHALDTGDDSGPLGKVFLLSVDETRTLSEEIRRATTTEGESGWWWLRSRDVGAPQGAAGVYSDGEVYRGGLSYVGGAGGVRPALWLNL